MKNTFPHQIPLGDLHIHTDFSDGQNSMEEIVQECIKIGHKYIAFTDHAGILPVSSLLENEKFELYLNQITNLNHKYPQIKILKGMEVNILQDGSLDLKEKWLKKMEIVIGSIHHSFPDNEYTKNTERYLKALDNPYLKIIGHPTTRRFAQKEALELDYAKVFEKAKEKRVALELNVTPDRMDLPIELLKIAKSIKNKIVINTDSHTLRSLYNLPKGVTQAQQAGLEECDILNYLEVAEMLNQLQSVSF